jgi:hypothetical protein
VTPLRVFAVGVIFVFATVAWFVLGGANLVRSDETGAKLEGEVGGLWGIEQRQQAPRFSVSRAGAAGAPVDVAGSDVTADFELDQRRKGLLWYATYKVDFDGTYRLKNPRTASVPVLMELAFPDPGGAYDGFAVAVDGKDVPVRYADGRAFAAFDVPAGRTAVVKTGYRTNGLDSWTYAPTGEGGVGVIKDFSLTMNTDFTGHDYPPGGVSPGYVKSEGEGSTLIWKYASLVSGRPIGIIMPKPANPGPLAARITFFAPVSLLFFFAALLLLTATRNVNLHPMHYGFLAAAFFAFHLLISYLADRVDINVAFAVASVASLALVLGYLAVVVGRNRALIEIGVSMMLFLVLFSYSFFFEGTTGLAITVGSVITLAFFMAKTAKVDWDEVFAKRPREAAAPPPPPAGVPSVLGTP